ncbi:methylthioribose-1-phosphate isomerase [Knoellia subterranea KCTC 19937]|uniref:Methylthioribose-1-phosphate isomerase n=1 Tax=Knoellia subterranea KCTC 19937 TaxID=1385521 RepID=A0A0A0JJI4_9MICO|nr:methylthioribose-1-phosphate isomerase [Knoellia subterranea KCTC 19937]
MVVLDQRVLPGATEHLKIGECAQLVEAIATLAVRGAPALGVAGAFGVVLAMDEAARKGWTEAERDAAIDGIRDARPTAVNLAWGVERVRPLVAAGRDAVLAAARELAEADTAANRELSRLAADWLLERFGDRPLRALTHCNAGVLATSGWGTALGVLRELAARDRLEHVHVDETRPLLQGSRLTAYELAQEGIAHSVQVDGAAASTIVRGLVDFAVVGADRIAANGDVANKVGTLGVALACHVSGLPLVVAAPWSTVDLETATGEDIEIEERPGDEVVVIGGERFAPEVSQGFNPAFDVTPARFVSLIATERGLVEPSAGTRPTDLA